MICFNLRFRAVPAGIGQAPLECEEGGFWDGLGALFLTLTHSSESSLGTYIHSRRPYFMPARSRWKYSKRSCWHRSTNRDKKAELLLKITRENSRGTARSNDATFFTTTIFIGEIILPVLTMSLKAWQHLSRGMGQTVWSETWVRLPCFDLPTMPHRGMC